VREKFRRGDDVRDMRKPLNELAASVPTWVRSEGAETYTAGGVSSFSVIGEDLFYIRIDGKTGTSPIRYAWTMMVQDRDTGAWSASPRVGLTTDDSYAVELNNASVSAGSTRYPARFNPQSGRVTFRQGGSGGGSVDIKSGETVLMLLGTYDTYKNCPDVPASPPTLETGCGEATTTLCVPAYAYAVYQRCGYIWNKVGDTRDFGVWANELNGGSTSAWRRFVIPRWGGDVDPATGLPDPDSECMGVAFVGSGASALTCSCPSCLSSPPEDACLAIRFRTPPRPCPYDPLNVSCGNTGCGSAFAAMDAADAWDKEYVIELEVLGCTAGGSSDDGLFDFEWQFVDGASLSCDWGPDVFDPCVPCEHWGRLYASIGINGGNPPNCGGAGIWRGEFKAQQVCDLLCDCGDTVTAFDQTLCNNCATGSTPFHFILQETIELICCPAAGSGVGALLAYSVASAYSVPQATPTATAVVMGSFADASIPDATAATPNAGAVTVGSTTSVYAVKLAVATAGAIVAGSVSALSPTDVYYIDSFEDL